MDVDDYLELPRGFGRFQITIIVMLNILHVFGAMAVSMYSFIGAFINHRCSVPVCDKNSASKYNQSWFNYTIPSGKKPGQLSMCKRYKIINLAGECLPDNFSNETEECDSWVFDRSQLASSATEEFEMVCDGLHLQSTAGSIFMVGMLVGSWIFGAISDRYGRRQGLLAASVTGLLSSLMIFFSHNYLLFIAGRFIQGSSTIGVALVSFVLILEFCPPRLRTLVSIISFVIGSVNGLIFTGVAYLERRWRQLQLYCVIPLGVYLLLHWWLPESLRWLVAQGKAEEAKKVQARLAKCNKMPSDEVQLQEIQNKKLCLREDAPLLLDFKTNPETRVKVKDILKSSSLRITLFIACMAWIACALTYYVANLNVSELQGNIYVNFLILTLVEIPADVFTLIAVEKLGRRSSLSLAFLLCGAAFLSAAILPQESSLSVAAFVGGKLFSNTAFGIAYIYTPELMPTVARNVGIGICSMIGRFGSIFAPYIVELGQTEAYLPAFVSGLVALPVGFLALLLPETKDVKLPDTIEEAEVLPRINCGCCRRAPPSRDHSSSNGHANQ